MKVRSVTRSMRKSVGTLLLLAILLTITLLIQQLIDFTPLPSERGNLTVTFCQTSDCEALLVTLINQSNESDCAFYDLDDEAVTRVLAAKEQAGEARVLIFKKNWQSDLPGEPVPARHGGLMHNKFCVLNPHTNHAAVITGSTNPTTNGLFRNDNNLLIIEGAAIVQNYLDEFAELEGGAERRVRYPHINHTTGNRSFLIENYFCPEDQCEARVLEELSRAKQSIHFLTFSFTSDTIGDLLVEKANEGVEVRGVFEQRQQSKYSEYKKLKTAGLDVRFDGNPHTMHHKLFLIDTGTPRATVIAGSYNPTKSGDTRNDENVLILHDEEIAGMYENEFARVWSQTNNNLFKTPARPEVR